MNNYTAIISKQCSHLSQEELIYHTSEQYLILCLKLCNLIIKNNCSIRNIVEFNSIIISNNNASFLAASSFTSPSSNPIILLSNLNETECVKYGHRESYKMLGFILGILLCLAIMLLNSFTLINILIYNKSTAQVWVINIFLTFNLNRSDT